MSAAVRPSGLEALAGQSGILAGVAALDAASDDGRAPDASAVRKAYHRVARKCHPDKLPADAPHRALAAYVFAALTDAHAQFRAS